MHGGRRFGALSSIFSSETNSEFFHPVSQGAGIDAEHCGSSVVPADFTRCFGQDMADMVYNDLIEIIYVF